MSYSFPFWNIKRDVLLLGIIVPRPNFQKKVIPDVTFSLKVTSFIKSPLKSESTEDFLEKHRNIPIARNALLTHISSTFRSELSRKKNKPCIIMT